MSETDHAPFIELIAQQRRGRLHTELSEQLHELTEAVMFHQKAGTLTLKITLAPAASMDETVLTVTDDVTVKPPRADREAGIWFVDDDNNLTRNDPQQTLVLVTTDQNDSEPEEAPTHD